MEFNSFLWKDPPVRGSDSPPWKRSRMAHLSDSETTCSRLGLNLLLSNHCHWHRLVCYGIGNQKHCTPVPPAGRSDRDNLKLHGPPRGLLPRRARARAVTARARVTGPPRARQPARWRAAATAGRPPIFQCNSLTTMRPRDGSGIALKNRPCSPRSPCQSAR